MYYLQINLIGYLLMVRILHKIYTPQFASVKSLNELGEISYDPYAYVTDLCPSDMSGKNEQFVTDFLKICNERIIEIFYKL